tara:strand:+ start:100 stop:231 length:132 start_codon:yes stop_codon:yes gene_type:complete
MKFMEISLSMGEVMGEVVTPQKSIDRSNKLTALFIKSVCKPGK